MQSILLEIEKKWVKWQKCVFFINLRGKPLKIEKPRLKDNVWSAVRPTDSQTDKAECTVAYIWLYIANRKKKVVKRHYTVEKRRSQSLKVGKEKKSEDRQIENEWRMEIWRRKEAEEEEKFSTEENINSKCNDVANSLRMTTR